MAGCKYCEFCVQRGQANSTKNNAYGYPRKKYYCTNPLALELPIGAFGNKSREFIGFGTSEYGSPLSIKTSPRWCPLRDAKAL